MTTGFFCLLHVQIKCGGHQRSNSCGKEILSDSNVRRINLTNNQFHLMSKCGNPRNSPLRSRKRLHDLALSNPIYENDL